MTDCSAPMMGAEQSVILPPSNEISGPSVYGASSTLILPPVVGLQPPQLYGLSSESAACKRSHAAEPCHRQYLGRLKKSSISLPTLNSQKIIFHHYGHRQRTNLYTVKVLLY